MIDKNGNKIDNNKQTEDPDFILAEIRFLMKGFRNESNDLRAYTVAKSITTYLRSGGNYLSITEILSELESYSEQTASSNFMWELVYIRREMAKAQQTSAKDQKKFAAECRHFSAKYFEKICKLAPTYHNNCCRVQEYIIAVMHFEKVNDKENIFSILTHAEDLFLQIDEQDQMLYYETGKMLYIKRYVNTNPRNDTDRFHAISKLVYFSREIYKRDVCFDTLDYYALCYDIYSDYETFPFHEEKENFKALIELLEEEYSAGNEKAKSKLDQLKSTFLKYLTS